MVNIYNKNHLARKSLFFMDKQGGIKKLLMDNIICVMDYQFDIVIVVVVVVVAAASGGGAPVGFISANCIFFFNLKIIKLDESVKMIASYDTLELK